MSEYSEKDPICSSCQGYGRVVMLTVAGPKETVCGKCGGDGRIKRGP